MPPPDRASSIVLSLRARVAAWSTTRLVTTSALAAAIITTLFLAPRYWLWPAVGLPLGDFIALQPEFHRAFYALQQLADPWMRIDSETNRVIEWRLLFPLLGHGFNLPHWLYLALPQLGCLLALAATTNIVLRATRDALVALGATLLVATTSWFFVSTGWLAYFDSWLILALLLATFAQARWVVLLTALLAPWVDERFILAAPLCFAVRTLLAPESSNARREAIRDALTLLAGIAPYLAVRAGAEWFQLRPTAKGYWAGRPLLPASVLTILWGAWCGLRIGWIAVIAFCVRLQGSRRTWAIAVIAITALVNLCVADDLSRSISVLAPVIVGAVVLAWRADPARATRAVWFFAAINLLLPAEHVIASANDLESPYHRLPIISLPAERARADEPPFFASPHAYNRRGMDAFTAGNTKAAAAAFEIALRFNPDLPRTHANRGIIRILSGDREGGMAELDDALTRAPWIYEARLQRAVFRQQQRDVAGALEDVRAALRYMPEDWPKRKDAESFERSLAAQVGGQPRYPE